MNIPALIENTAAFAKQTLASAEGGHDWFHVERVWKNAKQIAEHELCDRQIVELAALLHDIADSKFHNGDESVGPKIAKSFLESENVAAETIGHVIAIIENMSFKNTFSSQEFSSKELDVVRDADRLDAIGAIGIARAFNYGGFKNRKLYDPDIAPNLSMTKEEYKGSDAPTINHFYEKLLLLKDLMVTESARNIAAQRHDFMLQYLEQFYAEWNGER